MVERRKEIEIEEQEIKRKEKELIATVELELIDPQIKCIPAVKLGRLYTSRLGRVPKYVMGKIYGLRE